MRVPLLPAEPVHVLWYTLGSARLIMSCYPHQLSKSAACCEVLKKKKKSPFFREIIESAEGSEVFYFWWGGWPRSLYSLYV